MKQLNDSELIILFKKGNKGAFEELVMRYQSHVYTYILSITKNEEASQDIAQDVFIRIFKKLGKYNDENKFKNWLFTLSRNITMDYYRKNAHKTLPLENKDEDEFSLIEVLSDKDPLPIEAAAIKSKSQSVRKALDKLTSEERELIALKDSLTFKEIAEMQNKPIGTLLSKFNRALGKLKKILLETEPEVCHEYM
ncbi:RNA polymerase sigma factor [Endomicrobium proavitum]|uniref:Putative Sigma-70 family, RNA polymerase ECF-type sigma factor n=1 Tax=Endomicrobium proavitum TaxID=1408281 RepID=A0A0G3WH36_9BACT|nr:sigma-70 family RNA polymerase sigma factor [Endomicrobium proavitum]AKL97643.1 putative Sigma-70 family, RNA polymerase ECF-type sigma factor [Endomicrobium proavitum]